MMTMPPLDMPGGDKIVQTVTSAPNQCGLWKVHWLILGFPICKMGIISPTLNKAGQTPDSISQSPVSLRKVIKAQVSLWLP